MSKGGVVDRENAGFEPEWVQEAADREAELDRIMKSLPVEFARRWCEPGEGGCACLGCANGPEVGAGNLAAKGFTRKEWQAWWAKPREEYTATGLASETTCIGFAELFSHSTDDDKRKLARQAIAMKEALNVIAGEPRQDDTYVGMGSKEIARAVLAKVRP